MYIAYINLRPNLSDHTLIAAEVISAYVSHNSVPASDVPGLIRSVIGVLDGLGKAPTAEETAPKPEPAVPIRKSVHRDYLVSLEDGKRYVTLRRHLGSLGMTPDEYRAKWGLASDYPMVAQGYRERRSEISKMLGLGRKKVKPLETPAAAEEVRRTPNAHDEADASATAPETDEPPGDNVLKAA